MITADPFTPFSTKLASVLFYLPTAVPLEDSKRTGWAEELWSLLRLFVLMLCDQVTQKQREIETIQVYLFLKLISIPCP